MALRLERGAIKRLLPNPRDPNASCRRLYADRAVYDSLLVGRCHDESAGPPASLVPEGHGHSDVSRIPHDLRWRASLSDCRRGTWRRKRWPPKPEWPPSASSRRSPATVGRRACGWRAADSSSSDQDRARVNGALCSMRVSKSGQHNGRGPIPGQLSSRTAGTVQTRCSVAGNWEN